MVYGHEDKKIFPILISFIFIAIFAVCFLFILHAVGDNHYQNISTYGTAKQKATVKRCTEKYTKLKEVTIDNIEDIMHACRAEDSDQKLRNSISR